MKIKIIYLSLATIGLLMSSCKDEASNPTDSFDTSGQYTIADQMARPAINTVFIGSSKKNQFNSTPPSQMSAAYKTDFEAVLTGFGYTKNALSQDKSTFAGLLVTDVLNVATNKKTTFFDGTNVLTGRALDDDVIDTELLLIFGGPTGSSNPGLTKDNVNANDKAFLTTFPYLAAPF